MGRPRTKPLPQTSVDSNSSDASSPKKREQLKAIRELKGLTQLELADLLGTTPLNVSRWERGVTRPTPYFRSKLTKIFGKSEEELGLRMPLLDDSETSPQTSALATSASPSTINSTIQNSQNLREAALKSSENSISSTDARSVTPSSALPVAPILDSAIPDAPAKPIIGREQELSMTKKRLYTGGKAALTALNGLPGVGKTALSITIANDTAVREHFHDGVLWAALGPQPDLTIIMSRWSKQLGIPEGNLPEESDVYQWADEVNKTIGLRRMLIVIDDAWELDHALRLRVGGSNCAHLLTTRFPDIARNFVEELDITTLYELNDEESMKLLQRLAPNAVNGYEKEALALIRAVGGLPLALTLAGNYLRSESGSKNSDIIHEAYEHLSEAAARLELDVPDTYVKGHPSLKRGEHISLQTLFAVTDRRLSKKQQAAFYALSVFPPKPGDFSKEAAIAIAHCGSRELHTLHETGLLEDKSENIYTLHQTIADYAHLRLIESGEQHTIQNRLIAYALDTLKQHRKDYDILEREQSIILHALDTAHALNRSSELIQGATGFTPFLLVRALYDHAKTHLERAHQHALSTNNKRGIASTLLYLGELNLRQNHYKEANTYLEEGLKLARELDDRELVCDLLDRLGGVAWKQGKNQEAQIYLEEGLLLARELKDVERICNLLKALDLVADSMGESEQGLAYLGEGVNLARQAGNREQLCVMLMNSGVSLGE
ncbi:MAG TPA: hypothetical protein DHW02_00540, partial [Ktedonobacter sp.]|nr:hypothetical protein [Ktedonobacter sp.]